ncbi:SusF/SusE family outer membrane protein [Prolixibacteraceae bacterium JC049]|nr:SusF/SusE family outer membrane protein [Prolixibacteraceae bacterium JC049]
MKKILYIAFIGLLGLLSACEKDGDQVFMLETPVAPSIVTMPNLTLERNNGTNVLEFVCTPVKPGFAASANYFLEAAVSETNFAKTIAIQSNTTGTSFKIAVSELNQILLKELPADQASNVDFRVRSVLVVDAGTTAPGTGAKPFEYTSDVQTASVTVYGLPRLDLIDSGMTQKIESALGNGEYTGFVKFDVTKPFTLLDPDTQTSYGGAGGTLAANGSGIVPEADGWHILTANISALTYKTEAYMIGLVGSATPNGWDAPDSKMDYHAASGTWRITIDLVVGHMKFRRNDSWAWNMGFVEGETPGMSGNLQQGGVGNDIPINEAGNYTVIFTILSDTSGTYEIIKN